MNQMMKILFLVGVLAVATNALSCSSLPTMNYRKKGLQKLLEKILRKQTKGLVLTHKDRLLRFGAELVFSFCEGTEIVIINKGEQPSFEEELDQVVLEIISYELVDREFRFGYCRGMPPRVTRRFQQ